MSSQPILSPTIDAESVDSTMTTRSRIVMKLMEQMTRGSLTVTLPDGSTRVFGEGLPHAEIVLANWNVCEASFKNGDIGFGETYIAGDWSTPNLSALLDVMLGNRNEFEAVFYGTWWGKLIYRLKHVLNRNTRTGSKKNIHAHYDIGNDFYRLWLDQTMTYSSALFQGFDGTGDDTLDMQQAQESKYRRILKQLNLKEDARVLEVGCGWGGFAEMCAKNGSHVTGLTLSEAQLQLAKQRLAVAGVAASTDLKLQDYRDERGRYDGIASIEMFEAVGESYWPSYFETLKRSLKSGGRAVIQTITIDDALFLTYRKSSDFIQQYIFPGGMLPSKSVFTAQAARAGLKVVDAFSFGQDYARTLHAWLRSFYANERAVRAQGFDTAFIRTWAFYLAYCEAAFRHANTDVVQFTLEHVAEPTRA
jgi:cyclopropane-fatty-acyl-phospholipid synthase